MTHEEFYKTINLPEGVREQLREVEGQRDSDIPSEIKKGLFNRNTWDNAIKELRAFLGDDPYGMKILWEQINFACEYSYDEYLKRGISEQIFKDTFGFITRFVSSTLDENGKYKYTQSWWFQREVTLQEYRVGSLEYEFVEDGIQRVVELHIPSDADMSMKGLCQSVRDFIEFEKKYFPDWVGVKIKTQTWMIMPELSKLLPADSKINQFKSLFDIEEVDYEQTWYMGWIFPGYSEINEKLPEKTTLHRNLKAYLLAGNKFGIATGRLAMDRVNAVLEGIMQNM